MTQGIKDPITGKTYTYKGFVPLSRLSYQCGDEAHDKCVIQSPQKLVQDFNFEFAKATCCLCQCHFEGEVQ
jgi:hypothetical protein